MTKLIDLHTHSTASDGTFSPTELANLGKQIDLSAIALTDHDTIDGLDEFFSACKTVDIEAVSGVEISAMHINSDNYEKFVLSKDSNTTTKLPENIKKFEVHILCLGFPFPNIPLQNALEKFKKGRELRNLKMIKNFNDIGINMTMDLLTNNNPNTVVTRAHFANFLLEHSYVTKRNDAFEKYLSTDSSLYVPKPVPYSKEVIDLIHEHKGLAFLAHPNLYGLNLEQAEVLCKELADMGLDGIEVAHSTYTKGQTKRIKEISDKLGLIYSGGSDFHGANRPLSALGKGKGNLAVPYEFLDVLKSTQYEKFKD